MDISYEQWGQLNGQDVYLFKITHSCGAVVYLTNYGASIVSMTVADREGDQSNVILGFNHLDDYLGDRSYMGSTVGRVANRIGNASFVLNGKPYELDRNDGANSNHGGLQGFNSKVFVSRCA